MQNSLQKMAFSGLLISGLVASVAYAQDNSAQSQSTPPAASHMQAPNPDRQLKHLTKALNLSSDQQNQIKPLLENQDQQIQTLRADTTMDPKDKRAKFMSIRQDTDTKMESILNDQQKQQYEQLKAQQKAKMQERHQNQQPGGNQTSPPDNNQQPQ